MINGDVNEFVDRIYYGDELVFLYGGKKYFLQGWVENKIHTLCLDTWEPPSNDYLWYEESCDPQKLSDDFIKAPVFNGKTFWEVEKDIEWVDC